VFLRQGFRLNKKKLEEVLKWWAGKQVAQTGPSSQSEQLGMVLQAKQGF
jgi:hypothetical protein